MLGQNIGIMPTSLKKSLACREEVNMADFSFFDFSKLRHNWQSNDK
jgi:hypothetical protein